MVFAHIAGVPVEELLLPAVWGGASLGLALRGYAARLRDRLARGPTRSAR